jgi:hypothetical protein
MAVLGELTLLNGPIIMSKDPLEWPANALYLIRRAVALVEASIDQG